jgi:hypothetical protein
LTTHQKAAHRSIVKQTMLQWRPFNEIIDLMKQKETKQKSAQHTSNISMLLSDEEATFSSSSSIVSLSPKSPQQELHYLPYNQQKNMYLPRIFDLEYNFKEIQYH